MGETKSFNFTHAGIEKLLPAETGSTDYYFDQGQRNLCLAVSPKGNKSFYIWRKVKTRKVRFKIGRFPELSLKEARTECAAYLNRIEKGDDVEAARRAIREEPTLQEFFNRYLETYAKQHKKSWTYEESTFTLHLAPPLGQRKLSAITHEQVLKLHQGLGQQWIDENKQKHGGQVIANRTLRLLTLLYSKAKEWGYYPSHKDAPTRYVKLFKEKARERFLQGEELPRFFQALADEPNRDIRDYILVSLFTGARKSNVLSMTWHEVDFGRQEWRIPETKNGESLVIPLVDEVTAILEERKQHRASIFVFPGTGQSGHLRDPKRGWQRLLKRAEIENLTIHDLRRTLGSWQTIAGATPFVVGRSLGHKSLKSTQIYARMNLDPVRESVSGAAKLITSLGEGKK